VSPIIIDYVHQSSPWGLDSELGLSWDTGNTDRLYFNTKGTYFKKLNILTFYLIGAFNLARSKGETTKNKGHGIFRLDYSLDEDWRISCSLFL